MPESPDVMNKPRFRRTAETPRMETAAWVQAMSRRIEGALSRGWSFGFVSWIYLFRSSVNLSRTVYAYERKTDAGNGPSLTLEALEAGAIQIAKAMWGTYKDPNGVSRTVNGDMTKVRWVSDLTPAVCRLLHNIEHTCRALPGTQEARLIMRFDTQAMRANAVLQYL